MPIQNTIRDMYRRGESKSSIANALGIDRKTVRKYLEMDDFSPEPRKPKAGRGVIGPYAAQIDEWLESDRHVFRKQRHTAMRVFERLRV